jgi:hypothetical protein
MPHVRVASRLHLLLLWAGTWSLPVGAWAQSPETPLLQAGQLRFEIFPEIRVFDRRYGLRVDGGTTIEEEEPLGFDFVRTPVDADFLPALTSAQASLGVLLDDPSYSASLGASRARINAGVTQIPIGIGLGIFDWLTVGARVPFVRQRIEVDFWIDPSTANVGASPGSGSTEVQLFLGQLATVISATTDAVDMTCASVGEDDPACTQGRVALSNANDLLQAFQFAYTELVFPLAGSAAATLLEQRVSAIADQLGQVGDSTLVDMTLTEPIPWAVATLGDDIVGNLFTDPALGVAVTSPDSYYGIWELGDVEFTAALRLLQWGDEPAGADDERGAALPTPDSATPVDSTSVDSTSADSTATDGTAFLLGIGGTYRFGTGLSHLPDNLFDVGSGDGQDDIELHVFGRLDLGRRLRARANVRYGLQLEGTAVRRISGADDPIAPLSSRQEVLWDPGEYLEVEVVPEVRLAPELYLGLRYRYYSKGADSYSLRFDSSPDLPPVDLLNEETEMTVQHLGVGATLWPSRRTSVGGQWPLAVSAEYLAPISGSGGQTPKDGRFRVAARLFISIW